MPSRNPRRPMAGCGTHSIYSTKNGSSVPQQCLRSAARHKWRLVFPMAHLSMLREQALLATLPTILLRPTAFPVTSARIFISVMSSLLAARPLPFLPCATIGAHALVWPGNSIEKRSCAADTASTGIPSLQEASMRRTAWKPRYGRTQRDRKSTRLNSSHITISYAVFCLKKKKKKKTKINKKKKKNKKTEIKQTQT